MGLGQPSASDTLYTSRVSLYLKISNILRSRIFKGRWRTGDRLPNITALCDEFKVGRITVRQALKLLSDEGLITSSRGRGTFVISEKIENIAREKMSSQFKTLDDSDTIKILEITGPNRLPMAMTAGKDVFDTYCCVRKLRKNGDTPYCLMDIYVASDLFDHIPEDELPEKSISTLVSEYSSDPVVQAKQVLTIGFADYETSKILDCNMAAPVAEIDRFFFNSENRLLSRGHYLYRGDLFMMETEHMGDPRSDLPTGWLPEIKSMR